MEIKKLTDEISVSEQINPSDLLLIKEAGFCVVINNRPDGEVANQPTSSQIEEAANKVGLEYIHIPIDLNSISKEMIKQTADIIKNNSSPVFCYCRTGTRSTMLWALSQKAQMEASSIVSIAAKAGYDVSHLV